MLTLYQTRRAWNAPNISPFCTKLETYLRMADIPYELAEAELAVRKAPKGQVPFVMFEGQLIADSSRIIARLKERLGDTLDAHLSEPQRALGHLVQRTLEEGTYWGLAYDRWHDDANFEIVRQVYYGGTLGPALRWIVPDLLRRRMLFALYEQGTSRHDRSWVLASVARDLSSVSQLLGDKPYLFGDTPTSYDAVIYAISSSIWKTPFAKDFAAPPANIAAHLERIQRRYFPELG